jgi:hypothetical protein
MKAKEKKTSDEPMGIVIAGMKSAPSVTVFSAYEWAPAPVEDEPKTT